MVHFVVFIHPQVTSNEVNLLNRIKCLEADEGYSRTELDRFLSQERAMEETQGELKVRVEALEAELQRAHATIDEQDSKVITSVSSRPVYRTQTRPLLSLIRW